MDRAGKSAKPLSQSEKEIIFLVASKRLRVRHALDQLPHRHQKAVRQAFKVAEAFEIRGQSTIDSATTKRIVESVRYSTTVHYVEQLFRDWLLWKEGSKPEENPPLAGLSKARNAHFDELMEFGMRLRDRLAVRPPANRDRKHLPAEAVWHGSDHRLVDPTVQNSNHEKAWGRGFCNQKRHYLFQSIRSHLSQSKCWSYLESFEATLSRYRAAEQHLSSQVKMFIEADESLVQIDHEEACRFLQRRALWAADSYPLEEYERRVLEGLFANRFRERYLESPHFGSDLRRLQLLDQPPDHDTHRLTRSFESTVQSGVALAEWRDTTAALAHAATLWISSIGPDPFLRKKVTEGSCNLCPA